MDVDFLKQLETESFSELVKHRPGIPCDHPGCASHLSHPCEGCGRYAAGLQNGPDIAAGRSYIQKLAMNDTVIQSFLAIKLKNDWSWQQVMIAIIIKQDELNKDLTDSLNDANFKRLSGCSLLPQPDDPPVSSPVWIAPRPK